MNDEEIKKKLNELGIQRKDFLEIVDAYFKLISMAKKYSEKQLLDSYDLIKEILEA